MNNRKDNPQLTPQIQKKPQQRHGINPARDGNANTISGMKQFLPPNMGENALGKGMHGNMVQPVIT
ncbi:MAG TPA: hypothetical protein VJQ59_13005 [Candidatus Sulfotelmatobacter sp.]|nr:hypothetical protein [Candidatus Sulfotelmatobacter sp.]